MEKFAKSLQQPKPLPLKRPFSFIADFADSPWSPPPKRYRPESVNISVTQWVESISKSESESYRERHCRSDSLFCHHSDSNPISRRLTKSAPNMIAVPTTPASTVSRSYGQSVNPYHTASYTSSSCRSSNKNKRLVAEPRYRDNNLASNNIYMRFRNEQFPENIKSLVDHVSGDRDSPGPSFEDVWDDRKLQKLARGVPESTVQTYSQTEIFPSSADPDTDTWIRSDRMPIAKHAVPDVGSRSKVSIPQPDMLYGYNRNAALPWEQLELLSIADEIDANTDGLVYPFFVIEFKGDGPSGGGLWVATNQCLGGSASCVNIAERLNNRLRQCHSSEITLIDSAAFSVAMDGSLARLYISWKHDDELKYYMQDIKTFAVQEPDQYIQLRKYVWNIVDWGKGRRLTQIQDSLDTLLEESTRRASKAAKSRPSPSEHDSATSSKRQRKA